MNERPKIVSRTLTSQLAQILEDEISRGVWQVGQKIPSEGELVKIYGVSRSTLREVIHYLVLAGVLDVRPGDGTYVRNRTVFDAMLDKRLENEDIAMLMDMRELIEPKLASLVAECRTQEELENLLRLEAELEQSYAEHSMDYYDKDLAFHSYLAEICPNSFLSELYRAIVSAYIPFLKRAYLSFVDNDIVPDHHLLCERIRDRQPKEAKELSEELIAQEKRILKENGIM